MNGVESLLASRATFVLAALAVSWLAVLLLSLVVANLHLRLVRLERAEPAAAGSRQPFAHLLGRHLGEALGTGAAEVRLAVVLSSNCASCERVLDQLRGAAGAPPLALLWRDGTPSPPPRLPAAATVVDDGAAVCRALGVRVTPFALAAGDDGRIVRAAPVGRVGGLAGWLADADRGREPGSTAGGVISTPLAHPPLKGVPT